MLTLIALVILGFGYALEIAILRTILSSFIMGTFMSPNFILSFSGAVISTTIMGFFYWLSHFHKRFRLSIVGISVIGALSHNIVQLYLAYFILIRHRGIFVFLPWLCIGGVVMGWVTGVTAGSVCRKLKEIQRQKVGVGIIKPDYSPVLASHYLPGESFLHRLPAEIKIAGIFVLSLVVLIFNNFWVYLCLFFFLTVIVVFSRTPFSFLFSRVRRYASLVFVAFLLPLFFNSGTHVLSSIAYFRITYEGLTTGALFASRIVFLILASCLLVRTTSPEEMTRGLARMLLPLRVVGVSERRIATILSLSWVAIPAFWELVRNAIRGMNLKRVKNLRNLIPLLSDLIAALYLETERESPLWGTARDGQSVPKEAGERTKADFLPGEEVGVFKGGVNQ